MQDKGKPPKRVGKLNVWDLMKALEARRLERQWRERVVAFAETLEKHKEETRDIKSDMLRQYKVRHASETYD